MHTSRPPTDPRLIAAAALRHPGSLPLPHAAVAALIGITERSTGHVSAAESRLLTATLALLATAEIREERP